MPPNRESPVLWQPGLLDDMRQVSVHITLRDIHSGNSRTIPLPAGVSCEVGRSSKSNPRKSTPAPDNALYDCPVMSRKHASITARQKPDSGSVEISLIDLHSTHGTKVNGTALTPGVPHTLRNGDIIKFGTEVRHGELVHVGVCTSFSLKENFITRHGYYAPSESDESEVCSDEDSIVSVHESLPSVPTSPENGKVALLGTQARSINVENAALHKSVVIILDSDDDERIRDTVKPDGVQEVQCHTSPKDPVPDTIVADVGIPKATSPLPEGSVNQDDFQRPFKPVSTLVNENGKNNMAQLGRPGLEEAPHRQADGAVSEEAGSSDLVAECMPIAAEHHTDTSESSDDAIPDFSAYEDADDDADDSDEADDIGDAHDADRGRPLDMSAFRCASISTPKLKDAEPLKTQGPESSGTNYDPIRGFGGYSHSHLQNKVAAPDWTFPPCASANYHAPTTNPWVAPTWTPPIAPGSVQSQRLVWPDDTYPLSNPDVYSPDFAHTTLPPTTWGPFNSNIFPMPLPVKYNSGFDLPLGSEVTKPANKISIEDIVEQAPVDKPEVVVNTVPKQLGRKRKLDEVETEELTAHGSGELDGLNALPEASGEQEELQIVANIDNGSPMKRAKITEDSTMRNLHPKRASNDSKVRPTGNDLAHLGKRAARAGVVVAKYSLAAALGGVATIGFLCSPYADRLVDSLP